VSYLNDPEHWRPRDRTPGRRPACRVEERPNFDTLVRKLGQVGFGRPHTLMEALSPARAGLFLGAAECR
jgi:hypothetical protein